MNPSRFVQSTPIELLNRVAIRHNISVSKCPRSWKIRAIIAAHRRKNNLAENGPGYGADWKGLKAERNELGVTTGRLVPGPGASIKSSVESYLKTGKLPYAVEQMATVYYVEQTTGGPIEAIQSML